MSRTKTPAITKIRQQMVQLNLEELEELQGIIEVIIEVRETVANEGGGGDEK